MERGCGLGSATMAENGKIVYFVPDMVEFL